MKTSTLNLTLLQRNSYLRCLVASLLFTLAASQLGCGSNRPTLTTENESPASSDDSATSDGQSDIRERLNRYKPRIADYGVFKLPVSDLEPAEGVIEYELNTPLFTDYAQKQRLIKLPPGTSASYTSTGPLDFPVGTVIAKTFYYAADLNDPTSRRHLVETRILEHLESGWIGIPYVWNQEQTEATLAIAGADIDVAWKHTDGEMRTNTHTVPNLNDCKRCHLNLIMEPIGPKANNLNRDFVFKHGAENQLAHWASRGMLVGLPELNNVSKLVDWADPELPVDLRARAYLEVNCAHCHSPQGPARNSGLHLNIEETDMYHVGKFKTPVAAGRGTGGRLYGIVPGKPDESILEHRMQTTQPGEIMPEFGKSLVHVEGLELIRKWIKEMKP